jgi:prepilin-type N-terminal cleavage/methylation domain
MNNKKGFTLIEIIVVLVILAVLAAFTIPTMLGYISSSQEKLCNITRMDMTRLYKTSLIGKEASATKIGFETFTKENWGSLSQCPAGGDYTYSVSLGADGKIAAEILCSKHGTAHVLTSEEAKIAKTEGMAGVLGFNPVGPPHNDYTGSAKDIIIPKVLEGITVTGIWQEFFNNKGLTSVAFQSDSQLLQIHARAFQNNNLTEIKFPDSVTRIDVRAFYGNSITKITIGNGVAMEMNVFGDDNEFRTAYEGPNGGAGTYIFADGKWEKQE